MTAEQYLAQNAIGFEGDFLLKAHFIKLIEKHNIECVIETGTYMGSTTLQFSEMVHHVSTVEANPEYFNKAIEKFTGKDIIYNLGSSVDVLPVMIDSMRDKGKMLIFLDAHWGANNPLLQELKIIKVAGIKPVIAIHDFKVPDCPDLGYDSYDGQDYDWQWIKESVESIYGKDGFTYHYNKEAEGAKRGVIFIEPK
jgi:cephalosporin hydroxylase